MNPLTSFHLGLKLNIPWEAHKGHLTLVKRVWLQIKQEGLFRFRSMFPLARVPFWYRCFEPQLNILHGTRPTASGSEADVVIHSPLEILESKEHIRQFCLDVRTLTCCQLVGFSLNH